MTQKLQEAQTRCHKSKIQHLESLLNPCTRLDTRLHPGLDPGMDPGVEFSLECKCNVPNRRQGIISMLMVGRWADFAHRADPI